MGSADTGVRGALTAGRNILVEERDLDRARKILEEERAGFDEDELACLSEEAGKRWAERQQTSDAQVKLPASPPITTVTAQAPAKTQCLLRAFERFRGGKLRTRFRGGRRRTDSPDPFGR